jgi:hypothetical protein
MLYGLHVILALQVDPDQLQVELFIQNVLILCKLILMYKTKMLSQFLLFKLNGIYNSLIQVDLPIGEALCVALVHLIAHVLQLFAQVNHCLVVRGRLLGKSQPLFGLVHVKALICFQIATAD